MLCGLFDRSRFKFIFLFSSSLVLHSSRVWRPDKNKTKNSYYNFKNNVDYNSNDNNHDSSFQDYNSSVLTGSKLYAVTKCNSKDGTFVNYNNKSEINANNSSLSNNNFCADSEDNNDNKKDSNIISASTPTFFDSNTNNAPPEKNNKNNVRTLSFISHPNGIVLRDFKQKQSTSSLSSSMVKRRMKTKTYHHMKQLKYVTQCDEQQKMSALSVTKKSLGIFSSTTTPLSLIELKQRVHRTIVKQSTVLCTSVLSATKKLSVSFISHSNEIVLCVLKKSYTFAFLETEKIGIKLHMPSK